MHFIQKIVFKGTVSIQTLFAAVAAVRPLEFISAYLQYRLKTLPIFQFQAEYNLSVVRYS